MPGSARITIRLPATLDALVADHVRQGETVSDIVRDALEAYFRRRQTRCQTDTPTVSDTVPLSSDDVSDTVSDILAQLSAVVADVADIRHRLDQLERRQPAQSPQGLPDTASATADSPPPYDAAKYVLGRLCPRGHAYGTTGQTLWRLPGYHCRQCESALAKERRRGHGR